MSGETLMTKLGRKVRNEDRGFYRLARNGSICEVVYRATGTVVFEGTYAECSGWLERNGHDAEV